MEAKKQDTSGCASDRVARIRRMLEEGEDSDLFSPNFISNTPWQNAVKRGALGKEKTGLFAKRAFSDAKISVVDAIEEGNNVVVRWRLRGKWSQPIGDVKPTGQPVDVTGINIYRFVGDKIVEEHGQFDSGSFASQAIGGGINPAACAEALRSLASNPAPEIGRGGPSGPG